MKTWLIWIAVNIGAFFFARWGFSSSTFSPLFQQFGETLGINPSVFSGWLLPLVFSIMMTLFIVKSIGGVSCVVKRVKRYRMWDALGNRMKEAYSAKFGGENPAFNTEVDAHIKIMKTLGKGATKGMTWYWLRSRCKFVEIPCVVPEEECLAEVEKTRQFDTDSIKLS
jgi:hypothetical protein